MLAKASKQMKKIVEMTRMVLILSKHEYFSIRNLIQKGNWILLAITKKKGGWREEGRCVPFFSPLISHIPMVLAWSLDKEVSNPSQT